MRERGLGPESFIHVARIAKLHLVQDKPKNSHLDQGADGDADVDEPDAGLQGGPWGSSIPHHPIPPCLARLVMLRLVLLQPHEPVVAHSPEPQTCTQQCFGERHLSAVCNTRI